MVAGLDAHAADRDRDVDLAAALAVGAPWDRVEGPHPQLEGAQDLDVAHGAIDHHSGPPLGDRALGDHVAEQRHRERTAAVDHEHRTLARSGQQLLDARVVLEAPHGAHGTVEHLPPAEVAEAGREHPRRVAQLVGQVRGREGHALDAIGHPAAQGLPTP